MKLKTKKMRYFYVMFAIGLLTFSMDSVYALKPLPAPQNENQEEKVDVDKGDVVQFLETLEIFGRVEKPQTVFIIPGKDPRVEGISIKREFFKEMFRVVEKPTIKSKQVKTGDTPYIPF